ncbi:MAG: hypothetical protein Q9195_008996 [Heterodermia aff. obscurata]
MSSQTSLAANRAWTNTADAQYPSSSIYDETGNIWKYKSSTNTGKSGKRLAKIRSSPSQGALAAARASASRDPSQHKRGKSASVSQSPTSSTFDTNPDPYDLKTPSTAYSDHSVSSPKSGGKSKVRIKPLLRKLSSNDANAIDTSSSAADYEGLGIYSPTDFGAERKASAETSRVRRGYHHRSNSQVSTTTISSSHRYGAQYVHPMRQIPRPYTPPVVTSFQTSPDTEDSPAGEIPTTLNTAHSDSYHRPQISSASSYAPLPSAPRQPPPHLRTRSSSRLTNSSQTNLSVTPSVRQPSDHRPTTDNMFASTRSSLETYRQRSRTNTASNPAETAATVAELRRKFNEKQEAKDAKYHEAAVRQEAKEYAKRQKREESERRKSEGKERKRAKSNTASEKTVTMGEYDNAPTLSFVPGSPNEQGQRRRAPTRSSAGKAVHSQWLLFWFKVKTAWLKLKRKMSMK